MRLRLLDAHFIGCWKPASYRWLEALDCAQGIVFQCPLCAARCEQVVADDGTGYFKGAHYVICWFRNPLNVKPVPDLATPGPGRWWVESGTSIDSLTLGHGEPPLNKSILLSGPGCGWHGFIINGEATLS